MSKIITLMVLLIVYLSTSAINGICIEYSEIKEHMQSKQDEKGTASIKITSGKKMGFIGEPCEYFGDDASGDLNIKKIEISLCVADRIALILSDAGILYTKSYGVRKLSIDDILNNRVGIKGAGASMHEDCSKFESRNRGAVKIGEDNYNWLHPALLYLNIGESIKDKSIYSTICLKDCRVTPSEIKFEIWDYVVNGTTTRNFILLPYIQNQMLGVGKDPKLIKISCNIGYYLEEVIQ